MIKFTERTKEEQNIIRLAYAFEITAIELGSNERNPYLTDIQAMAEGDYIWEAINIALDLAYD